MATLVFGFDAIETTTLDRIAQRYGASQPTFLEPTGPPPTQFKATPEPLLDSLSIAQQLFHLTSPGDVVICSDRRGLCGLFVLQQACAPDHERRHTIVVAANSTALIARDTLGTVAELGGNADYEVDWELAAYRFADIVISPSHLASAYLSEFGVTSFVIGLQTSSSDPLPPDIRRVAVHGSVSRRAKTPEILRALLPTTLEVAVSKTSRSDNVWLGSTWDTLGAVRDLYGNRLKTTKSKIDVHVVGDPFLVHDIPGPFVVRSKSAMAAAHPRALVWDSPEELRQNLAGQPVARDSYPITTEAPLPGPFPKHADMSVSVAVPVFTETRYLAECLDSITQQTKPPHQVVVVVDGVDPTQAAEIVESRPGVELIAVDYGGVCAARNAAFENLTGDAFLLLDSDDLIEETFLEKTTQLLSSRPDISAAATWNEFFGAYEAIEAKPPMDARVAWRENPIVSTPALVRRSVIEDQIRFSEELAFVYCEDWEFWAQMLVAGHSFGLVPEPLAKHRVHTESGGFQRTDLALEAGRSAVRDRLSAISRTTRLR